MVSLDLHPLRGAVLGEVHARPFIPISRPSRLLHYGFMTNPEDAVLDRSRLSTFCRERGKPVPDPDAKYRYVALPDTNLRWEQHSEFTTYTWEIRSSSCEAFEPSAVLLGDPMGQLPQPGPLLAAVDLHILSDRDDICFSKIFDPVSVAASIVDSSGARVATDFRPGSDGFVRIAVLDRGLGSARAGALVQRLLEVETYRTLALLGLPEAQSLIPSVRHIEDCLTQITRAMTGLRDLKTDHQLLGELTQLAAAIEADANVSGYRLSASRAYDSIVHQRLDAIGEVAIPGCPTIAAFLSRRMAPAMRTCRMLEGRLNDLSQRLSRAAQLLRTRVDVEIEQQNRDLLETMNERVRLQLLLQQTVEGLSIAAISYYIISLAFYLLKGFKHMGAPLDPEIAIAIGIPFVVVAVSVLAQRVRHRHSEAPKEV